MNQLLFNYLINGGFTLLKVVLFVVIATISFIIMDSSLQSRHHQTSQRRKRRRLSLFGIVLLVAGLCCGSTVSEAKISKYDPLVKKHARRYGFDWRLISAQMYAESSFRPDVVSNAGAVGLMQIMPSTAKWLGLTKHC